MGITYWQHLVNEATRITEGALHDVSNWTDWTKIRDQRRAEFFTSMGLNPLPPRCDLAVKDFGQFTGDGYRACKLAYQILPDCWNSGHLYLPEPLPTAKLPAVLYVCGHRAIGTAGYQGHAIHWARRGYACFICDTIEQHDNPGDHHGLYSGRRLDWISLGYTAAGGELWNGLRALDLLAARPEVDPERIGVTGISGGGAQSFFLAVADERIKVLASVCGVASPRDTVGNRHFMFQCDCMYPHNLHRRDTSEFGALLAPRPALFCFADEDRLFSRREYQTLVDKLKRIYRLSGQEEKCRLLEYHAQHEYTHESILEIDRWFDRHLAGKDGPALPAIQQEHSEQVLTVFNGQPPCPNRLDLLPELLVPLGSVELPTRREDWPKIQRRTVEHLRETVFSSLAEPMAPVAFEKAGTWREGDSFRTKFRGLRDEMDLWVEMLQPKSGGDAVILALVQEGQTAYDVLNHLAPQIDPKFTLIALESRVSGFSTVPPAQRLHVVRAGLLVGLTPTLVMIQDLSSVLPFLRGLPELAGKQLYLYGCQDAGVACLYQTLLDDHVSGVVLESLPVSHRFGGLLLGILRVLDIPQAIGLVAPRPVGLVHRPVLLGFDQWAARVFSRLSCPDHLIQGQLAGTAVIQVVNNGAKILVRQ